jgi:hypothetical protein
MIVVQLIFVKRGGAFFSSVLENVMMVIGGRSELKTDDFIEALLMDCAGFKGICLEKGSGLSGDSGNGK